jgi:hypothetical protein
MNPMHGILEQWQHPALRFGRGEQGSKGAGSRCSAHIIISWFAFFPSTTFKVCAFLPYARRALSCTKSRAPPLSWPTDGLCRAHRRERPLFLTHFACLSIANNGRRRSSSSLNTHARVRAWRSPRKSVLVLLRHSFCALINSTLLRLIWVWEPRSFDAQEA